MGVEKRKLQPPSSFIAFHRLADRKGGGEEKEKKKDKRIAAATQDLFSYFPPIREMTI